MAKVEKLPAKRNNPDGKSYIVDLGDRSVQVEINPYASPYFYQPVSNDERALVMKLVDEYEAANAC
jgi:hypothetical protein